MCCDCTRIARRLVCYKHALPSDNSCEAESARAAHLVMQETSPPFAPCAGQMTRDVIGLRAGQKTGDVVALRVGEHAARPRSKAFRQLLASSRLHSQPTRRMQQDSEQRRERK